MLVIWALDLETHAGNAWVGLRVQLGHVPGHSHHQFHSPFPQFKKQVSPSCQRRRVRRSAAQQAGAEKATNEEETVEETIRNNNDRNKRNSDAMNVEETEGN